MKKQSHVPRVDGKWWVLLDERLHRKRGSQDRTDKAVGAEVTVSSAARIDTARHGKKMGTSHQGVCSKIKKMSFVGRSCVQHAICFTIPLVFYTFMEIELVVAVVVLSDDNAFHDDFHARSVPRSKVMNFPVSIALWNCWAISSSNPPP